MYRTIYYCTYAFVILTFMLLYSCGGNINQPEITNDFSQKINQLTAEEWNRTGQQLFESKSISPKKISCKSCHDSKTYFQDGYEVAIVHNKKRNRNTPTLLNTNRYTAFFWDGRANSIREQLEGPLFSRAEMHSNPTFVYEALLKDSLFENSINRVNLGNENQAVEFVMYALEQYILSISTKRTKFHNSLEKQAELTEQEKAGYDIFMNKAKCGRCHVPPNFTDNQYHDIGLVRRKTIFESYRDEGEVKFRLGPDFGRGNIVEGAANLFAFRTASLINVALTAPYMHDGTFHELEEVIDFYSRRDSILIQQPLSSNEKQELLAFLKTLNDEKYQFHN